MRLLHGVDARLGLVRRIIPDKDGTLINSSREFECFPFTLDPVGANLRLGGAVVSYRSVYLRVPENSTSLEYPNLWFRTVPQKIEHLISNAKKKPCLGSRWSKDLHILDAFHCSSASSAI